MLNPVSEHNFDDEFHVEQQKVNANRLGLIEALVSFKPPESTKTSVYKWYDTLRMHTKHLEDLNSNYVNKLQANYEDSNQKIINKMELTLVNYIPTKKFNKILLFLVNLSYTNDFRMYI